MNSDVIYKLKDGKKFRGGKEGCKAYGKYTGNGTGYVQPMMRDDHNNKFCLFQPWQGGWRGEACPWL